MVALVVQRMKLLWIEEDPCLLIQYEGIIIPAVPQTLDYRGEFTSAGVTLVATSLWLGAEVFPLQRICRCDQVPTGTPVANKVKRSKFASKPEGSFEARRGRAHQADALGDRGQRCHHSEGFNPGDVGRVTSVLHVVGG